MKTGLLRDIFLSSSGQTVVMVGNFVFTPVLLKYLGAENYGVWSLILALSGTAAGFDLGMNTSLMRSVPEYVGKQEYDLLSKLVGAVVLFYLALSTISAVVASMSAQWLMKLLKVKTVSATDAKRLLISAMAIMAISSLAGITRSILQGLKRFDVVAILSVSTFVTYAVIGWAFLVHGLGVFGLVVAILIMFSLQLICGIVLVRRQCPYIVLNLRHLFTKAPWAYLLKFGSRIQVSYIADIIKTQVPKFLAAAFYGPTAAGFYDLGIRISNIGWTVPASVLPAIIPTASEAGTQGDLHKLQILFIKGTRWILVVALPIGVVLAIFSKQIFDVWLGAGYESAAYVLFCLALGNVLHLMTGAGTFIGRGIARPEIETRYQLVTLSLYIVLCNILGHFLGFRGIPLGVALASTIGAIYFLIKFSRVMKLSFWVFLQTAVRLALISFAPALVLTEIAMHVIKSRLSSVSQLATFGLIFILVYIITLCLVLLNSDKNILNNVRDLIPKKWTKSGGRSHTI